MPKGRPLKTDIREKIGVILKQINTAYGYQIYKIYKLVFGHITLRNLYYNLKKGVELGEFIIVEIKREQGEFTWGGQAERKYYALGPYALFHKLTDVQKRRLDDLSGPDLTLDWVSEIKKQISKLRKSIEHFNSIKGGLKYEDKRKIENKLKANIEYLHDWRKQKTDRDLVLKAEIDKLNELFESQ